MMNKEERLGQRVFGQEDYEKLLDEIANTRLEKVQQYGPELQQIDDWEEASLMAYANIGRKWRRLKNLLFTIPIKHYRTIDGGERAGLRDALLDMANYCLYGVQMLDKLLPAAKKVPGRMIEQIAVHTTNPDLLKKMLAEVFERDLTWSDDRVRAEGSVFGEPAINEAALSFNYQLGDFEFEILSYVEGDNWVEERSSPGVSHFGLHVEDMDKVKAKMSLMGFNIAQEVFTQSHTNPVIRDTRRYWYVIYDTRDHLGFDVKFIQRMAI